MFPPRHLPPSDGGVVAHGKHCRPDCRRHLPVPPDAFSLLAACPIEEVVAAVRIRKSLRAIGAFASLVVTDGTRVWSLPLTILDRWWRSFGRSVGDYVNLTTTPVERPDSWSTIRAGFASGGMSNVNPTSNFTPGLISARSRAPGSSESLINASVSTEFAAAGIDQLLIGCGVCVGTVAGVLDSHQHGKTHARHLCGERTSVGDYERQSVITDFFRFRSAFRAGSSGPLNRSATSVHVLRYRGAV